MSLAKPSLVRPLSDLSTTETLGPNSPAALPSSQYQTPQPLKDPQVSSAPGEEHPQNSLNANTTGLSPPPRPSMMSLAFGPWRPHYSPSLKFVFAIVIMIVWPWIFYGVVKQQNGIVMNQKLTDIARKHPEDVDYFVTAIASAITFLIGYLFQFSVTRLAQKWVVFEKTDIFRVSFFSALKNRTFIWSLDALPYVFESATRFGLVFTVVLYISSFVLVTPGLTALLHPQVFVRNIDLASTEIDFSSNTSDCVDWFNNSTVLLLACNWLAFKESKYTTCFGENQMVDALESGRNNILSLSSNDSESITFTQLDGAHFLGPLKGVMPIGPNGLSAFGNLASQWPRTASIIPNSYNYTLHLQGLRNNVNCRYDTQSSIGLIPTNPPSRVSLFHGSCPPGRNVLSNPVYPVYIDTLTNNSLGYWACLPPTPTVPESYELYFRGDGTYGSMTGNMSCTVSSAQSAVFPVEYRNGTNLFIVKEALNSSILPISPALMRGAINALGHVVWGAQQSEANFVAESVITFGVKSFGLEPLNRNEKFLRLYEAMIQGLLDYQYSAGGVQRTSTLDYCTRSINGSLQFPVMGWRVTKKIGAYMIPITLITATSLVFILIAMFTVQKLPTFDPTNPISLIVAASGRDFHTDMKPINDPEATAAWKYQLQYNEEEGRFVPRARS